MDKLPGFLELEGEKNLRIRKQDPEKLAAQYGTPLYVLDEITIRENLRAYKSGFAKAELKNAHVAYAGKALLNLAMAALVNSEDCFLDVVSHGELFTALESGFDPQKIIFHGNNKSEDELQEAILRDVGRIVVDNSYELDLLLHLLNQYDKKADILFRVTPGVEADTHEYIRTAQYDSKFGIGLQDPLLFELIKKAINNPRLNLLGLHCHIGSQIMQFEPYALALDLILNFYARIKGDFNFQFQELNIGGGLGIQYVNRDQPLKKEEFAFTLAKLFKEKVNEHKLAMPNLFIEPGRSIVATAGLTLYKVGSIKVLPGIRTYVSVDGGMSDNIRPALYDAKYEVLAVSKMNEPKTLRAHLVGKHCETGDVLIKDALLPPLAAGDILAVLATGAYNYSMASNYNRLPKPAMILVRAEGADLIERRETLRDLISHDLLPSHLEK